MKRGEFIKALADEIAVGRKRNFPDVRRSEGAVNRMSDEKRAASLWRKHRAKLSKVTVEQFLIDLNKERGAS